ncbi:MAG: hypothetical protein HN712_09160 [Gemmatimonadetes bacterium]|jgi:ligand-binding sensor domain-containing protein|nr:hypothetical protein [Gemmatimonadota bacterium]MBT6147614.1 hypothetical protein [Gemmatimonadota bacterium]MBT7860470.1 hypothetical protein [Gemmatimonadota bacterium]
MGSRYNIIPILFVLCLAAAVSAQLTVDTEWAAFTSMSDANDIVVSGDDVWLATTGGVLHYNRATDTYRRFTRIDGLGGNQVLSVAADAAGDLWFGTAASGLSRLRAGASHFDAPFLEFRDRDIHTLLAYGDRLYVGTDRGLSVFLLGKEEVKESYRRLGNLAKDAAVNAIAIRDEMLFVGTSEGIAWADLSQSNLQDPDSWTSATQLGPIRDLVQAEGGLVAVSKLGAYTYNPVSDDFFHGFEEPVLAAGLMGERALVATEAGTFMRRLSPGLWQRVASRTVIRDVRSISDISDESSWLATDKGLLVLGATAPAPSSEPGSSRFYDLQLVDGDLWAASVPDDQQRTLSAGVYQLHEGDWTIFDRSTGMPNNELVALTTDQAGRVWVGSWGAGISVRGGGTWQQVNEKNSALQGIGSKGDFVAIGDLATDADGNVWVVNVAVGVAVIDGYPQRNGFIFRQTDLGQPAGLDLYRLAFSPDGLKALASRTHGLVLLDDGGTPFTGGDDQFIVVNRAVDPRLSSNWAVDILVDEDGTYWLATNSGLNAIVGSLDRDRGDFDIDSWRVYNTFDGLPSDEINVVELDGNGHLWVGTNGGLSRIDDGEVAFTLTASNSGLIHDRITGLLFDPDTNELWIGTFDGLSRLRLGTAPDNGPDPLGPQAVYPHPFVTDGRSQLTFAGLPLGASVEIYTLQGELVRTLAGEPGRGTVGWNGLNDAGFLVSSGIYLYVAQAPSSPAIRGRIAVIDGVTP